MKRIIIILAAVMLFAACEKQNDSKPTREDPGISWTDYNSVHVVILHFELDTSDYFKHLGDTILVEAYIVDRFPYRGICLEDDTVDVYTSVCIQTLNTSDSIIEWAHDHINEKVYFSGRLTYDRELSFLCTTQLVLVDIRLKDEQL